MKKSLFFFIPVFLFIFVSSVEARDKIQTFSINEALESEEVRGAINNRVKLYWGSQEYSGVVKSNFGRYKAPQRTEIMGKTRKRACEWALAGAIKVLQRAVLRGGGNAVINISSDVISGSYSSSSNFDCAVGKMMVRVELSGDAVNLGSDLYVPSLAERLGGGYTIDQIATIQARLDVLGYAPGAANGIVGPATSAAIKKYQADKNLAITGGLDRATVDRLYGDETVTPAKPNVKADGRADNISEEMPENAQNKQIQEVRKRGESEPIQ